MPIHKPYHNYLIDSLKDPLEAAAYLDAALEDGDMDYLLLALKNVAEAQQQTPTNGLPLAKPETLITEQDYQTICQDEAPTLLKIHQFLGQLGLKLSVTLKTEQ